MLFTVLVVVLVFSILIFIHELGHFLMAKIFGMMVEEFGFGLPPRIWGKKIGETTYSINALPIGGFVKLHGEDFSNSNNQEIDPNKDRAFYSFPKWKRMMVLLAGVTMNFILAVLIITFIFTQGVYVPTKRIHIDQVLPNSPAQKAGLSVNDVVLSINNQKITSAEELISITKENLGKETEVVIDKFIPTVLPVVGAKPSYQQKVLTIVPRKDYPKNEGPMGVAISNLEWKKYSLWEAPVSGLKEAIFMSAEMFKGIGNLFWKMITFTEVPKDVVGPLGIAKITGQAISLGWMAVLQLLGLLSLNLAVVNILPIPALDGGRLMFVVLEKIIGKRIKEKIEMRTHQVGMAFLFSLMILITVSDVLRILKEKGII